MDKNRKILALIAAACGCALAVFIFFSNRIQPVGRIVGTVKLDEHQTVKPEKKVVEKKAETKKVTLTFFGDLMLDRDVRRAIEKKGIENLFPDREKIFSQSDVNIANLEGPVADFQSKSVGTKDGDPGHYSFVFDPQSLPFFKEQGFHVFCIGNNHILNFGDEGLNQTKANLENNRIQYFGDPKEENNDLVYQINGVKIGLVSYNQFRKNDQAKMVGRIKQLKKEVDILVVYPHWGVEYEQLPAQSQNNLAHDFIDAGADAVIGSHPHVTEIVEKYQGKYIFYSLGNFVFDQFFSPETMQGLTVKMEYDANNRQLRYQLLPIEINRSFQVQAFSDGKKQEYLASMAASSWLDEAGKEKLRQGYLAE